MDFASIAHWAVDQFGAYWQTALGLTGGTATVLTWAFNRANGSTIAFINNANSDRNSDTAAKLNALMTADTAKNIRSVLFADAVYMGIYRRDDEGKLLPPRFLDLGDAESQCSFAKIKEHLDDPDQMYEAAANPEKSCPNKEHISNAQRIRRNWTHPRLAWLFSFITPELTNDRADKINASSFKGLDTLVSAPTDLNNSDPGHLKLRWTDEKGCVNLISIPADREESRRFQKQLAVKFNKTSNAGQINQPHPSPISDNNSEANIDAKGMVGQLAAFSRQRDASTMRDITM